MVTNSRNRPVPKREILHPGRRRTADLGALGAHRRELEALCFITVTLATLTDDLLRLVEMRITAIWRWAHGVAAEQVTPRRVRLRGEVLAEIRVLVNDPVVTDAAFRDQVRALVQPAAEADPTTRAADVRAVLCRNARRIRPLLELLLTLRLRAERGHAPRECLEWLRGVYEDGSERLWPDPPAEWYPRRWRPLVQGNDGQRALRAFEAATLALVRRSLRNGSLWSPYGEEFSDPARNLMPVTVWQSSAAGYRFRKNLPQDPEAYTDQVQAALRGALAGLEEAVANDAVYIGRKDLYFPRDLAERLPDGLDLVQSHLYRKVGRVQFPVLLLELDAQVHFS